MSDEIFVNIIKESRKLREESNYDSWVMDKPEFEPDVSTSYAQPSPSQSCAEAVSDELRSISGQFLLPESLDDSDASAALEAALELNVQLEETNDVWRPLTGEEKQEWVTKVFIEPSISQDFSGDVNISEIEFDHYEQRWVYIFDERFPKEQLVGEGLDIRLYSVKDELGEFE